MQRDIKIKNQNISYSVRESQRARCLRIAIHPGGELVATLPRGFRFEHLEKFILQKADWILRKMKIAQNRKPCVLIPKANRRDYLKYKNQALQLAKQKVEEMNRVYNFPFKNISIRNQRSRWGSCSQNGNLNFNYRIVHLPEKYLDYLVVHELCHLWEFNHSKKFWNLVAKTIPDHMSLRKEMRRL